jgi:hypothetical protein
MRRTTRMALLALGLLVFGSSDAFAGWNNVFQTTCCGGRSTRSSFFAPEPAPACCPQTQVNYVQRCYYQPVTTYKMETYQEPVTTYKTSYYWEPVTRMRYTSYYDSCSGCCQRVATPTTSYYLRSQCNAVQSYVQRCRMVPVTEMRKSYYMEPVVTYSSPCCDSPTSIGNGPTPGVAESGEGFRSGESREPPKIPKTDIPNSNTRPSREPVSKPIRMDRMTGNDRSGRLQGTLVRDDRITPRSNGSLKFVSEKTGEHMVAKADSGGRFAIDLPAGEWTIYTPGNDGKQAFHSTLMVKNDDRRNVTVVSR